MRYVVRLPVSPRFPLELIYDGSEWNVLPRSLELESWFEAQGDLSYVLRPAVSRNEDGSIILETHWVFEFPDDKTASEFRARFVTLDA